MRWISGRPSKPIFCAVLAEAVHHGRRNLVRGVDAGELVGVGKQVAFQRLGLGIDIAQQRQVILGGGDEVGGSAQAGLLDHGGDVIEVVAFGHDDGAGEDVAAQHAVAHLQRVGRNVELVLACLQAPLAHRVMHHQECGGAVDDAFALQRLGDVAGAPSGTQQDEFCFSRG